MSQYIQNSIDVKTAWTTKNVGRISQALDEMSSNSRPSSRRLANELFISLLIYCRLLKKDLHVKPHHIKLVHKLNEDDFDKRVKFCKIILQRVQRWLFNHQSNYLARVIFSLTEMVNHHNCVYWDKINPNITNEIDNICSEKLMVRARIWAKGKMELFFFEGSVNGSLYRRMFEELAETGRNSWSFSKMVLQRITPDPGPSGQDIW